MTHFMPMLHFYTPLKCPKPEAFRYFQRGKKWNVGVKCIHYFSFELFRRSERVQSKLMDWFLFDRDDKDLCHRWFKVGSCYHYDGSWHIICIGFVKQHRFSVIVALDDDFMQTYAQILQLYQSVRFLLPCGTIFG